MSNEQPFSISVSQAALDTLQHKLTVATYPNVSPRSDDEWDYGVPLKDIERLVARWRNGYDWRAAEAALNVDLPQYTRSVEVTGHGTFIAHYVHKKSSVEAAIPLLFVHGCRFLLQYFTLCSSPTNRRGLGFTKGLEALLKLGRSCLCLPQDRTVRTTQVFTL